MLVVTGVYKSSDSPYAALHGPLAITARALTGVLIKEAEGTRVLHERYVPRMETQIGGFHRAAGRAL